MNYLWAPSHGICLGWFEWNSLFSQLACRETIADSDRFYCASVWRGTRSARVTGCKDSPKPLMLRTLFATQLWQHCSLQGPSAWQNSAPYMNLCGAGRMQVQSDKCSSKKAAQRLVGEVSGVPQLVRQSKLTGMWLLQTCAWLSPGAAAHMCKHTVCDAWLCF